MATIKSYTDLEQSKVLSKILPLESADMIWVLANPDLPMIKAIAYEDSEKSKYYEILPAWSLAALLGVLPFIDFTTPQLIGTPKTLYRCIYNDNLKSHAYDNPIDACCEMILKLNELNLL